MVRASIDLESNNSSADSDSVSSQTSSLGIYEDLDNYKFEFPAGNAIS